MVWCATTAASCCSLYRVEAVQGEGLFVCTREVAVVCVVTIGRCWLFWKVPMCQNGCEDHCSKPQTRQGGFRISQTRDPATFLHFDRRDEMR